MLVYAKNANNSAFNKVTIDGEKSSEFTNLDSNGKYNCQNNADNRNFQRGQSCREKLRQHTMDILPVQGKFQQIILKRYKYLAFVSH